MRRYAAVVLVLALPSRLFTQQPPALQVASAGARVRVYTKQNAVEGVLRRASRDRIEVGVGDSRLVNIDAADIVRDLAAWSTSEAYSDLRTALGLRTITL